MFKLLYTNKSGQSIELYGAPFHLSKVEGIGDVESEIQTQKAPYQDGSTFLDSLLSERHISIELTIRANDNEHLSERRQFFSSVFNPKLGEGTLRYLNGSIIREITAIAEGVPFYPDGSGNRTPRSQKTILNLFCPSPYWRSTRVTEEPAFEPRFRFPTRGPFIMGIQRDQRIINNDGDAPAPMQIEFFGPALNPKIINNTTGEFIRIRQELVEGERMMVDTSDSTVYFIDWEGVERNVFPWIDMNSTFFKLAIGSNDIEYTADSDIQGTIVNISYRKLYNAV